MKSWHVARHNWDQIYGQCSRQGRSKKNSRYSKRFDDINKYKTKKEPKSRPNLDCIERNNAKNSGQFYV